MTAGAMTGWATGGCLCGALRYTIAAAPRFAGYCCCADCRHASGSGFIPFLGVRAADFTLTGAPVQHRTQGLRNEATRNFCPACGGLVFGGQLGASDVHTVYAGSLDDPTLFQPSIAIFTRDKPEWVVLPEGLRLFETMPPTSS